MTEKYIVQKNNLQCIEQPWERAANLILLLEKERINTKMQSDNLYRLQM